MENWTKVTPNEMKVGMSIANLKKSELQIKYAKDVCRLNNIIDKIKEKVRYYRSAKYGTYDSDDILADLSYILLEGIE